MTRSFISGYNCNNFLLSFTWPCPADLAVQWIIERKCSWLHPFLIKSPLSWTHTRTQQLLLLKLPSGRRLLPLSTCAISGNNTYTQVTLCPQTDWPSIMSDEKHPDTGYFRPKSTRKKHTDAIEQWFWRGTSQLSPLHRGSEGKTGSQWISPICGRQLVQLVSFSSWVYLQLATFQPGQQWKTTSLRSHWK